MLSVITLIAWLVAGLMVLSSEDGPSRFTYGMLWMCYVLELLLKILE